MAADRRVVRVSTAFFDRLDGQLEADRGSAGEPSATDFLVIDLPPIVDRFATDFEALPEVVKGVAAARVLVATDGSFGPSPCMGSSLPTIPSISSASNSTSRHTAGSNVGRVVREEGRSGGERIRTADFHVANVRRRIRATSAFL